MTLKSHLFLLPLAGLLALSSDGCASPRTVEQFVYERLGSDDGFRQYLKAAKAAQDVYHLTADTPMDELRNPGVYQRAATMVTEARDAFRKAATYGINGGTSRVDGRGIVLTDRNKQNAGRVRMEGLIVVVSVPQAPDLNFVDVKRIESSRGKEIVAFDLDMTAIVSREFRPFLGGDAVVVDGDFLLRLRRRLDDREPTDITPDRDR